MSCPDPTPDEGTREYRDMQARQAMADHEAAKSARDNQAREAAIETWQAERLNKIRETGQDPGAYEDQS